MQLMARVKLTPTEAQADSLKRTLQTANSACNFISEIAWANRVFGKFQVQKLVYHDVKATFELTAQLIIRCIAKVTDAYKLDKKVKREFQPFGSIAFDSRILSWNLDKNTVSLWTVDGRIKHLPFFVHDRAKELLSGSRGESDLCLIDGAFYLFTVCEVNEPTPKDVDDFLGVDLGIANIASDSDGKQYAGNKVNSLRKRHAKLRAKLQSKGTKSAKRLLKKRAKKEMRFAKDVNHQIAKQIVERAKDTNRGIALEDLTGIRKRVTVRKAQRRQHHAWSFHDLRSKIEYKAQLYGVPFLLVDPHNTSRACNVCGCIDKANRKDQATFLCVSCGHSANADTNAALNIRVRGRATVNWPNVSTRAMSASQVQAHVL
ncbi:MAG: transposase [Caldilinea sp. CFX5]|nr:transposase [Caldilinea sp. CFX5]